MKFACVFLLSVILIGVLTVSVGTAAISSALANEQNGDLELSVTPGTLDVTASWDEVPSAVSYEVRWRLRGEEFSENNLMTVTHASAAFTVPVQGLWIIRVEACNDDGCKKVSTSTVRVVINLWC